MARNGSGTMSIPYDDFTPLTTINSSQIDANFSTIVAEITNSIARDGQSAPTANLPMGGFKLTGLGNGAVASDSVTLGQVQSAAFHWVGTVGGTGNAITLSPSPAIASYTAGQVFRFLSASANTGAVTVNVSGLGVKNVRNNNGAMALVSGDITANTVQQIIYDGTQFILVNLQSFGPGAAATPSVFNATDSNTGAYWPTTDTFAVTLGGATSAIFQPVASTVNYPAFRGSATGNSVSIVAEGSDTNIGLTLAGKGTGVIVAASQLTLAAGLNFGSDTLDTYDEGTWTPTDASGAALSLATAEGSYVRIGSWVLAQGRIAYPVTANASVALLGGLPFTVNAATVYEQGFMTNTSAGILATHIYPVLSSTTVKPCTINRGNVTNADLSGAALRFVLIYRV